MCLDHTLVSRILIPNKNSYNLTILLDKLKHYGVEGVAHDLLKNYLENRKQFVQLNDHSSEL